MNDDIKHMKECIKLAKYGIGEVSPNPMVGCVIINQNGDVVSTGYHKRYGENHAERDALLKIDHVKDCTLYVNLEPCCHYGKTPPCADLIIEKGVKKVVYGMEDVNPIVRGKGLKKLKDAGIEVVGPILEDECKNLNEIFITNKTQQRTFVALKTATTIDGKIATSTNDSKWITSEIARNQARNIRKQYDAILTSSSTVKADNPTMAHKKKIILDRCLSTDLSFNIYKDGEIFIFHDSKLKPNEQKDNVKYIGVNCIDSKLDINVILKKLYDLKIYSILVEAGGVLSGAFLPYVDKLYYYMASKILGDNTGKSCFSGRNVNMISECYNLNIESINTIGSDILIIYNVQHSK